MKLLGWWLMLVGTLRLASVWFGFFNIWALRLAVFSKTMSEVHGRTFGVWTLLTCTLCYLCAFNLDNKPLYLATLRVIHICIWSFLDRIPDLSHDGNFKPDHRRHICRNFYNMDGPAVECTRECPRKTLGQD